MAERSIKIRLEANIEGYRRAMRDATQATNAAAVSIDREGNKITTSAGRMVRSAEVNREAWNTSGTALTAFGAVGVAALGLSAKAAIDWESAWTGVLKTVDGAPEQLAALEDGLRSMALRLPASTTEIAAVAEAAGQLGVKIGDVEAFTETMINLGETTNLSATDAATAIARMSNIMGTAVGDANRLGSVIVDLGNNSATTEAEILEFGLRLAAAGKQAGLSEGEILAFGATLSSLGVNAEAGGTAMSKVFYSISDAVIDGGEKLAIYAEIAGMTSAQFQKAYGEDAAGTIAQFTAGLGSITDAGGSTTAVLEELELTDQRLRSSLSATAASGGLLADSLALANQAWADNTALIEEAEKRYDTTDAKIQIAKNSLNEAAIVIGENLLPMLAGLAEGVADVAQWFANLPAPIQGALTGLTGIVSVASLAAGGFLLLFPRVMDVRRGMTELAASAPRAAAGMKGLMKGGLIVGAVLAGLTALTAATESWRRANSDATLSVAETTKALLDMEAAGGQLENAFGFSDDLFGLTGSVNSLADAAGRITDPSLMNRVADFSGTIRGIFGGGGTSRTDAIEQIDTLGESLSSLVQSGDVERAETQFGMLADQWEAGGGNVEELKRLMPAYTDALADNENQATLAADATGALALETEQLATETGLTQEALDKWRESAANTDAAFLNIVGAYDSAIAKNTDLAQSTADATESADDSWETYYDGVSVSSTEYIEQLQAQVDAQNNWETNMLAIAERVNEGMTGSMRDAANDMIDELLTLGPEGAAQVQLLNDMTDEELAKVVTLWGEKGTDAVSEFVSQVEGYRHPVVELDVGTVDATRELDGWIRGINSTRSVTIGGRLGRQVFADGGPVSGPGTSTSDSIPARLSNGEHVWTAKEVRGAGGHQAVASLRSYAAKGYAGGGPVFAGGSMPIVNVSTTATGGVTGADLERFAMRLGDRFVDGANAIAAGQVNTARRSDALATQLAGRMG